MTDTERERVILVGWKDSVLTKSDCEGILSRAGFVQSENKKFWYRSGVYELHCGEYASPNYYVRYRKGGQYGVKVVYYYYPGTFNAPSDHFLKNEELALL